LKVLDAGQVLYDVLAVGIPRIDAIKRNGSDSLSPFLFSSSPLRLPDIGKKGGNSACIRSFLRCRHIRIASAPQATWDAR
jgi:hypothetical protein